MNSKNKLNRELNTFSVSQSSYDCYLKQYYDILSPIVDNSKLGLFTIGDKIHDLIQSSFISSFGKNIVTEVTCSKEYSFPNEVINIIGHADIIWNSKVIEVKSVSPFAWKYYVTGGRDKSGNTFTGKSKISHIRQLNMYMELLNLSEGIILYINKDTLEAYPYLFKIDNFQTQQTIGRCLIVYRSILSGKLPPKVKGDECSYCMHKQKCKLI